MGVVEVPYLANIYAHDHYEVNEAVCLGLSDIVFLRVTRKNPGEKSTDHILTMHIEPELKRSVIKTGTLVHVRDGISLGFDDYDLNFGEEFLLLRTEPFHHSRWRLLQITRDKFKQEADL